MRSFDQKLIHHLLLFGARCDNCI